MFEKSKRPAESFISIVKLARFCAALVGADCANPNYQTNSITYFVIGCIMAYFIFSIITIIKLYEEKPMFILEASCMLSSVLQGVAKLFTAITETKNISATVCELEDLYTMYQTKGNNYCIALNKSCERLNFIIKLVGFIYLLSMLGIVSVPFLILLATGKRYLMLHFLVPGLDIKTSFGYFGTTVVHSLCMFSASFGLFSGDLFALIFFSQPYLFVDILVLKIQEFDAYTVQKTRASRLDFKLRDIIMWQNKFTNFNKMCNKLVYYIAAVHITTSGISIVLTLFVILTGDWPGAYTYIWLALHGLYMYSILGTQTEISNDLFLSEIYNIKWYNLPLSQQKSVAIMLHKAQHPAKVEIASVMPLTVSTALQITKSCYSIFMLMLQFLADKN